MALLMLERLSILIKICSGASFFLKDGIILIEFILIRYGAYTKQSMSQAICFPMAYATRVLLAYDHQPRRYYLQAHGAFKEDGIFDMDDLKCLGPNGEDTLGHAWQKKRNGGST